MIGPVVVNVAIDEVTFWRVNISSDSGNYCIRNRLSGNQTGHPGAFIYMCRNDFGLEFLENGFHALDGVNEQQWVSMIQSDGIITGNPELTGALKWLARFGEQQDFVPEFDQFAGNRNTIV